MSAVKLNFNNITGKIKPMHAVNNGPKRATKEQSRGNFDTFAELKIPYVRNHDASFCAAYGGEHTVDVHAIFPDFNKNPYDPASYDFALTDDYTQTIIDAGSKVFYRLGSKIEHWRKKYGTIVPADFYKWAVICEHIIMHYNEGWADGFHHNIEYWEIWNEPEGISQTGDTPNWSGTFEQFYDFYEEVSLHLKKRFPKLKIGGPAVTSAYTQPFMDGFAKALTKNDRKLPLDFYSYHSYTTDPYEIGRSAQEARKYLDDIGYTETELILNEWNYVENWTEKFVDSILAIIGMRGAAFTAACMSIAQKSPLDMFMYYDARIDTAFNGLFDLYTLRPLHTYYVFKMFSDLYEIHNEAESVSDDREIFVTAASNGKQKAAMITYYSKNKESNAKIVTIEGLCDGEWKMKILNSGNVMKDNILFVDNGKAEIQLANETVIYAYSN